MKKTILSVISITALFIFFDCTSTKDFSFNDRPEYEPDTPDTDAYYTVTYNINGAIIGDVPSGPVEYKAGDVVTVLDNTNGLVLTGCVFKGWCMDSEGNGTIYTIGDKFTMLAEDITLYAIWREIHTVSYNGNIPDSGSPPANPTEYVEGDTVTVLDNTGPYIKSGYAFDGWCFDSGGTGTVYKVNDTFIMGTEDKTLYAKWKDITPPANVVLIVSSSMGSSFILKWVEPSDGDYDHIRLSCSSRPDQEKSKGITTCTFDSLTAGTNYAISAFTVDTTGNESTGTTVVIPLVNAATVHYIFTDEDLNAVHGDGTGLYAGWALSHYYLLLANIDISGYSNWTPIGGNTYSYFTGTFDGNGHVISNLTISSALIDVGLFGYVDSAGTIKNLGIEVKSVYSSYPYSWPNSPPTCSCGALIGRNYGTVQKCYARKASVGAGTVDGVIYIGGLIGGNEGTVSNCYTTVDVGHSSAYQVGGLIGLINQTDSAVTNCYATGIVTGQSSGVPWYFNYGGLIGDEGAQGCGTITSSYYNSANNNNGYGTPKSLAEMKVLGTYSGWNFDTIWNINISINNGYPYLRTP